MAHPTTASRTPAMSTRHLPTLLALALLVPPAAAGAGTLEDPDAASAVRLGADWLSTEGNDFNLSMGADERLLVFGRSSRRDFHDAQIWMARREGDGWSDPEPAPFTDARWRHSDPWLTPDGRWLYFVSSRPAPGREAAREDLDLWRAPLLDGRIGSLEHLAAASSPGEELGPELHDGWLVFNSTRKGGPAPMALYRARLVEGVAAVPEPMPAPFNDGRVQGDLTFSPDGRSALFWSVRGDSPEPDLFLTRRHGHGWSAAVRLPAPFNAPGMDFTPAFSADGRVLRWASQRPAQEGAATADGRADLYAARSDGLDAARPAD